MKSFISIISIFIVLNAHSASLDNFISAIGKVESNNNPKAVGDNGKSLGIYQIQLAYFKDVKIYDKRIKFDYQSLTNKNNSKKILIAYLNKWEPLAVKKGDWQTLAKAHNGGNNWRNKTGQAKAKVQKYWLKVKNNL